MENAICLDLPVTDHTVIETLTAGTRVLINGTIYVGRDAAHKKMIQALSAGDPLPIDVRNQAIYYMGPAPTPLGKVCGSAGPTSSYRMDAYSPQLLENGLKVMIGKGRRSPEVIEAMKRFKAVYLVTTGGAAALISKTVVSQEIVAYGELGPEALRRLVVKDFPAIVAIDSQGGNLYVSGQEQYRRELSAR